MKTIKDFLFFIRNHFGIIKSWQLAKLTGQYRLMIRDLPQMMRDQA